MIKIREHNGRPRDSAKTCRAMQGMASHNSPNFFHLRLPAFDESTGFKGSAVRASCRKTFCQLTWLSRLGYNMLRCLDWAVIQTSLACNLYIYIYINSLCMTYQFILMDTACKQACVSASCTRRHVYNHIDLQDNYNGSNVQHHIPLYNPQKHRLHLEIHTAQLPCAIHDTTWCYSISVQQ